MLHIKINAACIRKTLNTKHGTARHAAPHSSPCRCVTRQRYLPAACTVSPSSATKLSSASSAEMSSGSPSTSATLATPAASARPAGEVLKGAAAAATAAGAAGAGAWSACLCTLPPPAAAEVPTLCEMCAARRCAKPSLARRARKASSLNGCVSSWSAAARAVPASSPPASPPEKLSAAAALVAARLRGRRRLRWWPPGERAGESVPTPIATPASPSWPPASASSTSASSSPCCCSTRGPGAAPGAPAREVPACAPMPARSA